MSSGRFPARGVTPDKPSVDGSLSSTSGDSWVWESTAAAYRRMIGGLIKTRDLLTFKVPQQQKADEHSFCLRFVERSSSTPLPLKERGVLHVLGDDRPMTPHAVAIPVDRNDARTLASLLEESAPPPLHFVLRVAHEIALALAFTSSHDFVVSEDMFALLLRDLNERFFPPQHSNVRPANVLITSDGRAHLGTYRVGRLLVTADSPDKRVVAYDQRSQDHAVPTTDEWDPDYLYAAPELLNDPTPTPTTKSDRYMPVSRCCLLMVLFINTSGCSCRFAYGMTLWCLFSGRRRAWEDDAGNIPLRSEVIDRLARGDLPPLDAMRHDVLQCTNAVNVIKQCWSKEPSQRPQALTLASMTEKWINQVTDCGTGCN